ncbi:helix-turn-helix domain-containing protein [Oxalobacter sp. OttesenSCG-928-P03]|nr:helix-turn-helix domain-containing protein [Oxalobacter sp. OttesenSCG-928-P03]
MSQLTKSRTKKPKSETGNSRTVSASAKKENNVKRSRNREIAGFRLINKIRTRSIELGLQDRYIADMIGVTPIYWYSIANGHRKISSLSKEKLKKIAEFLNIPTVQAMNLADVLDHDDFFLGQLEDQLNTSIDQMRNDPAWMCWAPTKEEWNSLSIGTRTGIVMLYETVFYKSFLSRAEIEHPELKNKVKDFVEEKFPERRENITQADL